MSIDIQTLRKNIQEKKYAGVYLLCGEERYLVEQYRKLICSSIIPEGDEFNMSRYFGKDIDYQEIASTADTLPLFSDYRLILLEDTGLFAPGDPSFIIESIKNAPEQTIFLFVEHKVDKRSALYKYVDKNGIVSEMNTQKDSVLIKWIIQLSKATGFDMSEKTCCKLLEKTGPDMYTVYNELQKLFSYSNGEESISVADISRICTDRTPPQIFEMIRCMSEKNISGTLSNYYELMENKEPPLRILNLLVRQFRILYKIKLMKEHDLGRYEISSALGLNPYIADKSLSQSLHFQTDELLKALEDCEETELSIKTGLISDSLGIELILVRYSS